MSSLELSSKMRTGTRINLLGVTLVMRLTLVKWIFQISKGRFFCSNANVVAQMQNTSLTLRSQHREKVQNSVLVFYLFFFFKYGLKVVQYSGVQSYLSHEVFPEDPGCSVGFQLDVGRRRQQLIQVISIAQLMVGAFDPVTSELRQQDQRKRAFPA